MRITDQYFWNVIFLLFFTTLIVLGTVILDGEAYKEFDELTPVDYTLITLATWRMVRLVIYDKIFAFFREQFMDVQESKGKTHLVKPASGPRRTVADLLYCPWCFGVWSAASVSFFYLLTPYAFYPVLILALSAVASSLQIFMNMIGWKSEQLKQDVESR